jgi:hypothetical protein
MKLISFYFLLISLCSIGQAYTSAIKVDKDTLIQLYDFTIDFSAQEVRVNYYDPRGPQKVIKSELDTLSLPGLVSINDLRQDEINAIKKSGIIQDTFNPNRRIQLVSRKKYDFFPVDVVNRFNSQAPFFFDANDRRVKSIIYKNEEDIPQVYYLRENLDTVYFYLDDMLSDQAMKERRNIRFSLNRKRIEGDLADYLVRLSFRKEFLKLEEGIQVTITDVGSEYLQNIIDQLKEFRIIGELRSPLDESD